MCVPRIGDVAGTPGGGLCRGCFLSFCVLYWLTSLTTGDLRGHRLCELRGQKNRTTRPLFRVLKVLAKLLNKHSQSLACAPSTPPPLPAAKSGISSPLLLLFFVEDNTQKIVLIVCGVWSPLCWAVLALTHISCLHLPPTWTSSAAFPTTADTGRRWEPASSQITILPSSIPTLSLPLGVCTG